MIHHKGAIISVKGNVYYMDRMKPEDIKLFDFYPFPVKGELVPDMGHRQFERDYRELTRLEQIVQKFGELVKVRGWM